MAYEALDSLQQTLTQILKRNDILTTRGVKLYILPIHDKAVVLQFNLKAFPEKEAIRKVASTAHEIIECVFSPENLSDCGWMEPSVRVSNQLTELAEELDLIVGDVLDYCRVNDVRKQSDYPALSSLSHGLERLAEKILSSPRDLADYSRSKDVVVGIDEDLSYSAANAVSSSSRPSPTSKDGVVVGFDEDLMQIMDRLISDSPYLKVLPIVGMAGIGKSTLAKIVYDHPLIMEHFDIRAWVTVSQDFSLKITCLNLLASMKGKVKGKGKGKGNHSVGITFSNLLAWIKGKGKGKGIEAQSDHYYLKAEEIYKNLHGRRYLIVLDDIWSTKVCDDIWKQFPNNYCGSRIILTTRLRDVAAHFSHIHEVRFLDDQQSWHLFQRKVFADQTCPLELQSAAKKIVRSRGGLPLAIVTVAEHLSRIGTTPKLWEQIVATDGDGQLESILSLSYNPLPHHLKACFLYMAGFPQDYKIRVSELVKLWVAEGFIRERQYSLYRSESLEETTESLEETAEEYLEDLVKRSLVLVTRRKIDGKIKSCRLHNMVRDFCVRQAGQEKFLLSLKDYLPSPILRRHFLPQVLKNHRRISASWYDLDLKDSLRRHGSYTQSIICIPQRGYRPKGSVRNFRLLRVLHVLRRDDHSYWELGQVFDLIYLRYLASNIPCSIVPPVISKLQNLQTLIIYRYEVRLPVEIWRMRQLRHLIAFSFDPLPHPEAAALPIENLLTLSLATDFVCSGRMVEIIPNIQKLGICFSGEKFDEDYHLDNLAHFLGVEKLKLEMRSGSFWPSLNRPVFPESLKKLTLSGCRLPWSDMTCIGSLPNLQVLRLRNYAFDGEQWETTDWGFYSLLLLLIDESNLQQWTTESSRFPRLKCLMLHRCPYLSEIPSDIGYIRTLKLIEVDDLNKSLFSSAKKIQEEQESMGNEDLRVHVKHF
ncbi:hypothetical protein C2S51_021658 [Perilla frutescens var. frutescens]|nr:hypothetical protein C2S51_021658 [Perilla frutescens var. frutescens]